MVPFFIILLKVEYVTFCMPELPCTHPNICNGSRCHLTQPLYVTDEADRGIGFSILTNCLHAAAREKSIFIFLLTLIA